MDLMQEHDDDLNRKVILLSVGSAAAAALLVALARHRDDQEVVNRSEEVAARAEDVVSDAKQKSKKAAKAAKNKRKEMAAAVAATGHRAADEIRDAAERLDFDAKAAERDLKAAAWDAQQEAKEAESRLRAAGHRVVDDATQLASWVGAEARNLAGEGKEKIAQLRHREEGEGSVEREVERLRAEIDELKEQLRRTGQKVEKDPLGLASRFGGKSGPFAEAVASEATAAALAQIERTLRAKAPALLAARNKAQVLEILQKELGSTLRDPAVQAAVAALGKWDWTRESGNAVREAEDHARTAASDKEEEAEGAGEEHRGKAGLFWGGAGIGLALYALLDAERRDRVLRLANEASVQVQELVRDLQGYDDEF